MDEVTLTDIMHVWITEIAGDFGMEIRTSIFPQQYAYEVVPKGGTVENSKASLLVWKGADTWGITHVRKYRAPA